MPGGRSSDGHKASDFGADRISTTPDWRGSGYDHHTAYSRTGGQVSWSEAQESNGNRHIADVHISGRNIPDR